MTKRGTVSPGRWNAEVVSLGKGGIDKDTGGIFCTGRIMPWENWKPTSQILCLAFHSWNALGMEYGSQCQHHVVTHVFVPAPVTGLSASDGIFCHWQGTRKRLLWGNIPAFFQNKDPTAYIRKAVEVIRFWGGGVWSTDTSFFSEAERQPHKCHRENNNKQKAVFFQAS